MSENLKQFIESRQIECKEAYEALSKMGAWDGWYKTLSSLYPDNAHFVFELLQNAEDANATMVKFELDDGSLSFKHDGTRDFNEDDVYSITNVGDSKKGEETNKIGKFGVGFKSVFAYTTSPKIYSKTISFEIEHLFIPSLIDPEPIRDGYTTVFNFPFDRDDKSKADAFSEIKALFDELGDNVLLFLTNIQIIKWQVANSKIHQITKEVSDKFIEINNSQKGTSHWLVFRDQVEFNDQPLTVSVAYSYNKEKNVIEPIRGDVSIFFPAKKETSKLKFHIDAPFSSTVARDSIVESSENDHIMKNIANLCSESIHKIKDQGLLSMSFFDVLPNKDDELDEFYEPILESLIAEFESNENKLIPLEGGSFGSLDSSIYCSRIVRDTFTDQDDIYNLLNHESILGFAKFPLKNSRSDKFLSGLKGLVEYEDFEIFNRLYEIAGDVSDENLADLRIEARDYDDDDELNHALSRRRWLEGKSDEYLQGLYAFLFDAIEQYSSIFGITLDGKGIDFYDLKDIIKLSDGSFNYGYYSVYFSDINAVSVDNFRFVSIETYTSGKSKNQQQKAKNFLEKIGVVNVDASTHIKLLFDDYEFVSEKEHLSDINSLVNWYLEEQANNPNYVAILDKIHLSFDSFVCSENGELFKPIYIYIDEPYKSSGLRYIDDASVNHALHLMYQKIDNLPVFIEILILLGAQVSLEITRAEIGKNPNWRKLWLDSLGQKVTSTSVQEDWNIVNLTHILELTENRFKISRLIWDTVSQKITTNHLSAKFRMSQSYGFETSKSQLIFNLMSYEWIPDKEGNFHKPQDIDNAMLSEEFNLVNTNGWLHAIEFGKNIVSQQAEYKEKVAILGEYGISIDFADKMKREGLSMDDLYEEAKKTKSQKLSDSMGSNSGDGKTSEVADQEDSDSIIIDPEAHQDNIVIENEGVTSQTTESAHKVSQQDSEQLKKIKNYLYREYSGYCQICGDTFEGNKNHNIFMMYSLNRSKKGAQLQSDVNRKGNSLSLCPKHHKIFQLGLQSFSFLEKLDHSELSLTSIEDSFEFRDGVGKGEDNEYDGFYNRPEGSSFEKDVFMLPITLFSKRFYLKFSQDHIQQFIEVWNNN